MGRLLDCQIAFVTWGVKARFRQGKVGLLRKASTVYLVIVIASEVHKFPIDKQTIVILPAAIRFKTIQKDLFIRQAHDEEKHHNMVRAIKVLLRRDEIRRTGKGDRLDKLIADIPQLETFRLKDQVPTRVSTILVGNQNLALNDSLNRLALIECNLAFVPKQLESLSRSLQYLDLSKNSINKLPRTFCCKMNNLRYLNLSHNMIETLPLEIKFFSRLVDLDLSKNHLRLLPTTFSDLRSLRTLNVASNKLSQLPAFRKEDIRLEILDISNNPLDGALDKISTFELYPSYDNDSLGYRETLFSPYGPPKTHRFPTLFEITMLNVVRNDRLFKLASEEALPQTTISTMQRDVFKCYSCNKLQMLPAYSTTDYLDYIEQVQNLITSRNYRSGMTFMKILCRGCFVQ